MLKSSESHRTCLFVVAVALLAVLPSMANAFTASLAANPSPSTGDFTLTWLNPDSTLYQVEEQLDGSSTWANIGQSSGTSFSVTGKPAGTHSYRLLQFVEVCPPVDPPFEPECEIEEDYSETITVTVEIPPPVPTGLSGPATDEDGTYTMTWNASTGATSYDLQRLDASGVWTTVYSGSATSHGRVDDVPDTYSYEVRACDSMPVCSDWSATVVVVVDDAPEIVTGVTGPATVATLTSYTISWNTAARATTYNLEEQVGSGSFDVIWSGSNTSYEITGGHETSSAYSYRVEACNSEGVCSPDYSATHTVIVGTDPQQPAPSPDPDPDSPPPVFTVPDDTDFPDATIVTPFVPDSDTGPSVGAVQGSGGVSGGQASYSIPIMVPPGRKGMQPSVSLNYSSLGGNGVAGVGWSLNAGSAISRCAATVAQDGFTAAVQYHPDRIACALMDNV